MNTFNVILGFTTDVENLALVLPLKTIGVASLVRELWNCIALDLCLFLLLVLPLFFNIVLVLKMSTLSYSVLSPSFSEDVGF